MHVNRDRADASPLRFKARRLRYLLSELAPVRRLWRRHSSNAAAAATHATFYLGLFGVYLVDLGVDVLATAERAVGFGPFRFDDRVLQRLYPLRTLHHGVGQPVVAGPNRSTFPIRRCILRQRIPLVIVLLLYTLYSYCFVGLL